MYRSIRKMTVIDHWARYYYNNSAMRTRRMNKKATRKQLRRVYVVEERVATYGSGEE